MEFEKDWLLRQCKKAAEEVATWPEWKKAGFGIIEEEPLTEAEYNRQREDAHRYGNY